MDGEAVLWHLNTNRRCHFPVYCYSFDCIADLLRQGAVAVEGEAVLWHPTALRPPWGPDSGLGDGPDAAGADSDGADSGDWYDEDEAAGGAAAPTSPTLTPAGAAAAAALARRSADGQTGSNGGSVDSGDSNPKSGHRQGGNGEAGAGSRGAGDSSSNRAAQQGHHTKVRRVACRIGTAKCMVSPAPQCQPWELLRSSAALSCRAATSLSTAFAQQACAMSLTRKVG